MFRVLTIALLSAANFAVSVGSPQDIASAASSTFQHRFVVFVPGIGTQMDSFGTAPGDRCPSPRGDETFTGLESSMMSAGLSACSNYLFYSYQGDTADAGGAWHPKPYSCFDTGDSVNYSVGFLVKMIDDIHGKDPRARFVLVGHSLGGVLALRAATRAPKGSVFGVVTIDSPLKHASAHNRAQFLTIVNRAVAKAGQRAFDACARPLWDSDAARDLGNISDGATRKKYGEQVERAVRQGQSDGIKYMTIGNASDCVWDPNICHLKGKWDDDRPSMLAAQADISRLYPLGTGGCNLAGIDPYTTNNPASLYKLGCVATPHGIALNEGTPTVKDVVSFTLAQLRRSSPSGIPTPAGFVRFHSSNFPYTMAYPSGWFATSTHVLGLRADAFVGPLEAGFATNVTVLAQRVGASTGLAAYVARVRSDEHSLGLTVHPGSGTRLAGHAAVVDTIFVPNPLTGHPLDRGKVVMAVANSRGWQVTLSVGTSIGTKRDGLFGQMLASLAFTG